MKRLFTVLLSLVMLAGASCKVENTSSAQYEEQKAEVQAAWNEYVAAAVLEDYETLATYVDRELDDFELGMIVGYYQTEDPKIDWFFSKWSDNGNTVELSAGPGEEMETWHRGSDERWTTNDPIWWIEDYEYVN